MKVLVTGGAGFIGSHIVDGLLAQGDQPVVVDNLSTGSLDNIPCGVPFYRLDIKDHASLQEMFHRERPQAVYHHAAQMDVRKSMRDPCFDAQVNILGSLNLISLSVRYEVCKFIFASTSAVYPDGAALPAGEHHPVDPISAYGLAKHVIEKYLHLYSEMHSMPYTALRYGNVYGPRQNAHGEAGVIAIFAQQLLSGIQPIIFGDGSKTRDYIHVADIVRANLIALNGKAEGVFNLGWGREISDLEVFRTVRDTLGLRINPLYKPRRLGELTRVSLNSNKANEELSWRPCITFEQGILTTVGYYLNQCTRLKQA